MKSGPGDVVTLHAPGGSQQLHIVDVRYERVSVASFTEPPGAEAAPKPSHPATPSPTPSSPGTRTG
jgi:transcription elongation factor GreB